MARPAINRQKLTRLSIALLLAGACAFACSPTSDVREKSQSIADGSPAPDDSAVFYFQGAANQVCTATLITPRVLLTATHCLNTDSAKIDCDTTTITPPAEGPLWVSNVADLQAPPPGTTLRPVESALSLNEGAPFCGNDLALLILEDDQDGITPLGVAEPPEEGDTYTAIGYGAGHQSGTGERIRRRAADLSVSCVGPSECDSISFPQAAGAPGDLAAPHLSEREFLGSAAGCPGDSGGPALSSQNEILGVLSRGTEDCQINIYSSASSAPLRAAIRELTELHGHPAPAWSAEAPPVDIHPPTEGGAPSTPEPQPIQDPLPPAGPPLPPETEDGCSCKTTPNQHLPPLSKLLLAAFLLLPLARRRFKKQPIALGRPTHD